MEAGTGKTRVAVELVRRANPDAVLWVGPYRTITPGNGLPSIISEIEKWGGFGCQVKYTGIESIQSSDRIYLEMRKFCENAKNLYIIVDESLKIKNAEAKRTKRLLEIGKFAKYKLILSGTPITRNLLDIWSQMEFLSPKILNMPFAEFKNTFCEYTRITKRFGRYKKYTKEFITGYENIDYLYSLIRNYVYECNLSLRISQSYNTLNYTLDDNNREAYRRLKTEYLNDEKLRWKNNNFFLELTQKMQHTYCCTENKFEVLDNLFNEIDPSRTIIFCKYVKSHNECRKRYPKATVLSYQKESLGLNLQHLNNTVYFDKNWDYALRIQSGRRTFRTGQERDCRYWDLTGDVGLERMIDKNIAKKTNMAEYFKGKTKEELREEL
jgi:SNF2 family DNA or RNA helicase